MKLGYIRVSTKEQNIARQKEELLKHGVEERFLFVDKTSGKSFNREQYQILKLALRQGDELYVHELDRLGRNKKAISEELQYFKDHNIIVRILDVPTTMIDYSTFTDSIAKSMLEMINNLLIEVLSTLAEQELAKLHKRQSEGILAAHIKGVKFGRPCIPFPESFSIVYDGWKNKAYTAVEARRKLGITHSTFYRMVKKYESSLENIKTTKK